MKNRVDVNYHVVAFMDLMGQQEKLRKLDDLSKVESVDLSLILNETYGTVRNMRKAFKAYFDSFSKNRMPEDNIPFDKRGVYKTLKSNSIRMHQFSDFVTAYFSLKDNDQTKLPMAGVFAIFGAAASTTLLCLATGHPLRGGIELGWGIDVGESETYGGALANAYVLESKVADFPRIVVGPTLIQYLKKQASCLVVDDISLVSADLANKCLSLIVEGTDGYWFIDFLNESFRLDNDEEYAKMIADAYSFVEGELIKFKNVGDVKLILKYENLNSYMKSKECFKKR